VGAPARGLAAWNQLFGGALSWYEEPVSSLPACPVCSMSDVVDGRDKFECSTCGNEWAKDEAEDAGPRLVKDANGNVLADGDTVVLIKELKLKGGGGAIKIGTKVKNIRLVQGDHDIDCKIDGQGMMLKSQFVKKA
jgi:protein PhnA